jgi:hypothetical protein
MNDFLIPRNQREITHLNRMRQMPMPPAAMYGKLKDEALRLAAETGYPVGWVVSCLLSQMDPSLRNPFCGGL